MLEYLKGILGERFEDERTGLEGELQKLHHAHAAELERLKIDFAVENATAKAGARSCRAVGALLNRQEICLDENGQVVGLQEQLALLQQQEPYLFQPVAPEVLQAAVPKEGVERPKSPTGMGYEELCGFFGN